MAEIGNFDAKPVFERGSIDLSKNMELRYRISAEIYIKILAYGLIHLLLDF